jgi:hypothetical protein
MELELELENDIDITHHGIFFLFFSLKKYSPLKEHLNVHIKSELGVFKHIFIVRLLVRSFYYFTNHIINLFFCVCFNMNTISIRSALIHRSIRILIYDFL